MIVRLARAVPFLAASLAIVLIALGTLASAVDASPLRFLRAFTADLRLDKLWLDRGQAKVGDTVRATVRVSNLGRKATTSTVVTLWAIEEASTGSSGYQLATLRLGTLRAGESVTAVSTFQIPNFPRHGRYKIMANVEDPAPELNAANNVDVATLDISSPSYSVGYVDTSPSSGVSTTPPVDDQKEPTTEGPSLSPGTSNQTTHEDSPSSTSGSTSPGPTVGGAPPAKDVDVVPTPAATDGQSSVAGTCDYYASPDGVASNSGTSKNSPFRIEDFWPVAGPGKTLCLMDGTYQGSAQMITPPPGLSGSRGAPITVRALNDGGATVDGEFQHTTFSVANSWFVFEGFNVKNSSDSVLNINDTTANTIFRRLVLWDAHIAKNNSIVSNNLFSASSTNILLEDIAMFGTGRKCFVGGGGAPEATMTARRIWCRWEGSITQGPKIGISTSYGTYNFTCENCLVTWSAESMPQEYNLTDTKGAVLASGSRFTNYQIENFGTLINRDKSDYCTNTKIFGSMVYVKATDRFPYTGTGLFSQGLGGQSCVDIKHVLAVVSPARTNFNSLAGFAMGPSSSSNRMENVTSIRGAADNFGGFVAVNVSAGKSASSVASPWTTTGSGANLCYRWVDGVQTNEQLWPWPMNDRIKEATARAGAYEGPCPSCVGGRAVRKATDVTADIEELLGPIPASCRK